MTWLAWGHLRRYPARLGVAGESVSACGATRETRGTAVTAAAIVMDQGGQLSHGSILAREYGIPCVVNVGPATKVIKTGRRIEVDGDLGPLGSGVA